MLTTIHLNVKPQLGCLSGNETVHKCQNVNRDEGGCRERRASERGFKQIFFKIWGPVICL